MDHAESFISAQTRLASRAVAPLRVSAIACGCLIVLGSMGHADNSLRGGAMATPHGPAAPNPSQTTTAATGATSQATQTGAVAQHAQVTMLHSVQALQALQSAQSAARSAALNANNLGLNPNVPGQTLPNVPNGLAAGGLVPGVLGVDAADPSTVATTVPVVTNANGSHSVSLGSSSAITIPTTVTGPETITASGTGVIGTVTTGSVITPLKGGVATSIVPGSTISITQTGGSTVTFAGGSTGIPETFSTYHYGTAGVPASWSGIGGLTQSTYAPATGQATGQTTVTVTQTQQQALLTWQSFNVGKNTLLDFDQSAGGANVGQWVAINQIKDASIAPSQILGAIQAPGQVYVINQNGIIFGGASQVNVGALTASSLALNPAYITNGLLNDAGNNYQFQFSSLFTTTTASTGPKGHKVTTTTVAPLWTAPPAVPAGGTQTVSSVATGDVTVQAGAQIKALTNAENQGGRVALIAPNVVNNGTISTPDGQTILAAGLQVGFAAHKATDASLRGLDVFVGQVSGVSSTLPTGTFTFNGLPGAGVPNETSTPASYDLTLTGTGQVGTYTAPGSTTPVALNGGTTAAIPAGSTVILTSDAPSFGAVQGGVVTNGANTLDSLGNIVAAGGDIEAPRANVTLTGATVNQLGIINGSTSVALNGRIDLLANYNSAAGLAGGVTAYYPFATGAVNLGGQSVTQILPELANTATTIGTSLPVSSLINIEALSINMQPGSLILAPSANKPSSGSSAALDLVGASLTSGVTLNAGSWFVIGSTPGFQTTTFSNASGDITLGTGSVIDVSGSENVSASVTEDIIAVDLRGPQLANSPLQQNGALRGETVYIDIRKTGIYNGTAWIGTPIGDVSGYINNIQRTVGELTTDGGTVALNAGHNVSIGTGASINVSGGWINYAGANIQTTKVVTNGQVLDISQATPNLVYSGIYSGFSTTSTKWGVQQTFNNPLLSGTQYDAGYVQGGNGGRVAIAAPSVNLNGNFYGNTVTGSLQRTSSSSLNTTYAGATFLPSLVKINGTPQSSTFDLSFLSPKVGNTANVYQATSPDVVFQTDSYIAQNSPAANQVLLSQDIVNVNGFGNLNIDTKASGSIVVPAGVSLGTSPGGQISFDAANIDIQGDISAPGGGALNFTVTDFSPTSSFLDTPIADPTRGHFILGPKGSLSSSGVIVDDLPGSMGAAASPFAISGGTISIAGLYVDLASGSRIDVSGGVALSATGTQTYGNAGAITILGGQDPNTLSLVRGGQLFLGSTLTGYSGKAGGGGSLTVQAPLVQIGGSTLLNGDSSPFGFGPDGTSVVGNGTTLWFNKENAQGTSTDFFSQGGFGNFTIKGLGQIKTDGNGAYVFNAAGDPVIIPAVLIAANTHIHPVVQNFITTFADGTISLTPMNAAQSAALLPSERTAVNLTFSAEGVSSTLTLGGDGPPKADGGTFQGGGGPGGLLVRGDLVMQAGASIQTGPQINSSHGVTLSAAHGTAAILGSVIAPGGTISVKGGDTSSFKNNDLLFYGSSPTQPFATVDLGPNSLLSTAGAIEQTVNSFGFVTGSVLGGGNISISGNIVAERGATVDVSGASAVLDETAAALGLTARTLSALTYTPTIVESNGGSITFNATQLLYSDATLLGSAGASAQGGSLTVSSKFASTQDPNVLPPTAQSITLIVSQSGFNGGFSLPVDSATGLAVVDGHVIPGSTTAVGTTVNSAFGGDSVYSYFAANPNLFVSSTSDHAASNNGGRAGGFASLSLDGTVDFIGPVTITTKSSLNIAKTSGGSASGFSGGVIYADSSVTLTAPYVALNGYETSLLPDVAASAANPAAHGGSGGLTVNASVLTDVGNLSLQNISTLNFNATPGVAGDIRGQGTLQVAGQINLNAAQIYPPTEATFTIEANKIVVTAPANQALPALPLSGGGTLNLFANTIEQGGVLRAPFGIINIGNGSTQNVRLSPGSVTSVSGVDPTTGLGITAPYGIVNDNGTWYDPNGNDISLTGPAAKAVNITGQNVRLQTGSTIDLTGGGNLSAYSFTPGTGGTQDILASQTANFSSTSFAIIPGYSSHYAPDGTYANNSNLKTSNAQDVGYYNSALAVGEQIYLNGSNGLAAGTYTLLPARYALLPGAFLVTAAGNGAPGVALAQPDGSSLVSGYLTSGLNPTTSPVFGAFQIYSQTSVLARAPYTINLANTYFPSTAASHNLSKPRLPVDSGQLVLNATQAMTIQGTLLSQAGAGGLGGEVDIASTEDIYIVGSATAANAPSGALVLDSSQLTDFGAASLLIGGFRTTTNQGTAVTVTTGKVVIDNSGASTTLDGVSVDGLAAPDVILVSTGTLDVRTGSTIDQIGQLSGRAQALTLQGNGVLLRVSSDSSAQISRQNVVAGDTTSVLSIGQGATIRNANGGAAGSLILDSTSLVTIDPAAVNAPVLDATALTFDSSLINLEAGTPATAPTAGLVITKPQLDALLSSTQSLAFLSYSSIALYGSGEIGAVTTDASGVKSYREANLSLHADDIYYADTQNSTGIVINARTVSLDNLSGGHTLPTVAGLGTSDLTVNAETVTLGSNATRMDQFDNVAINADSAILLKGLGSKTEGSNATPIEASFSTSGNLVLTTPLITTAATADQNVSATTTVSIDESINAAGTLVIQAPASGSGIAPNAGGLAGNLLLTGSSVTQNSGSIVLHSGTVGIQAASGDVVVNGTIDVTGVAPTFYNLNKFTNGGQVSLTSLQGNVSMGSGGLIDVSAASGVGTVDSGAGQAGGLNIHAAGTFTAGQIKGQAGKVTSSVSGPVIAQGTGGSFSLDVGSLDPAGHGLLSSFENALTGFDRQSIRDRNDSTVTVDDVIKASSFALSADQGSVVVTGTIDASNVAAVDSLGHQILVGGSIRLEAGNSVTLQNGSVLDASGANRNNAGQGGSVTLQAGAYRGTAVATTSASVNLGGTINLAINGSAGGTLYLRAPQVTGGAYVSGSTYVPVQVNAAGRGAPTDVAIGSIADGAVRNAGTIVVEGFYAQDAHLANALIDDYKATAESNATTFTANSTTIENRIFGSSISNVSVRPGEEIDNSTGSLELQNNWDFSSSALRYGASGAPGMLTIRAAGNISIDFGASITDGFDGSGGVAYTNVLLPAGQSWTYNLTSGADFGAAASSEVQSASQLSNSGLGGSFLLGVQNSGAPIFLSNSSTNDPTPYFQTIRTGTGDITIHSGGDVLLLNELATIYTAGSQVDATLGGTFVPPSGTGLSKQTLPSSYSTGGGNVSISAQGDIARKTYNGVGNTLVEDSSPELPTSWLDREGSVSAGTPTTWWIDFTNFFEGVGALGGGNVSLSAGGSVVNVDAAVPTNGRVVDGQLTELGGGNLHVSAGNNIDGGVYYVEKGQGTLAAGNDIQTNATRAAVPIGGDTTSLDWLPTTFFLGKGDFSVNAGGNLLLGPVANPFLLPQSINNTASAFDLTSELSYFSTYAATDSVNASSLAGKLTIKDFADGAAKGSLYAWYTNILNASVVNPSPGSQLSDAEPWLRLAEATNPSHVVADFGPAGNLPLGSPDNVFGGVTALLPPTFRATAFSGDLDLIGGLTLSPSANGTVNLLASGSINAFRINESATLGIVSYFAGSGLVNLSDANPNALPGINTPLSSGSQLATLNPLFTSTGVTEGLTLQTRQLLHATINGESLHANDASPVYVYANTGDISGLTVYSAKQTQVIAGQDITDVGLYIQNNQVGDISLVSAGRDIIAYDASSALRLQAGTSILGYDSVEGPVGHGVGAPNSGDIQISGPGTLEVLAGRNLTLGNDAGQNPNATLAGDGLNTGLTSVGGQLNPNLPFEGADLIAAAGVGGRIGTGTSSLNFTNDSGTGFTDLFLNPAGAQSARYLPDLGALMGLTGETNDQVWTAFNQLSTGAQNALATKVFYLVLRDSGRDHNDPSSPGVGVYTAGYMAISALLGETNLESIANFVDGQSISMGGQNYVFKSVLTGAPNEVLLGGSKQASIANLDQAMATNGPSITVTSREIKTSNGGDISLLVAGGKLTVGVNQPTGQAVDQGILTVDGGNIGIATDSDVVVGTSRIFTLHGGNEVIWSSAGGIAAGAASVTVVSAPPTRVVVDPTSGSVQTDLAGLSTGGGIGVLASVIGAPPGDVDLIAPFGTVDAGDAGIRASGRVNIAAAAVANSSHISSGAGTTGVATAASVNLGALSAASSAAGSSTAAANNTSPAHQNLASTEQNIPSIITVEVLGYGGGDRD